MWGEWRLIVQGLLKVYIETFTNFKLSYFPDHEEFTWKCFGLVIDMVEGVSVLHNNTGIILDLVYVDLIYY